MLYHFRGEYLTLAIVHLATIWMLNKPPWMVVTTYLCILGFSYLDFMDGVQDVRLYNLSELYTFCFFFMVQWIQIISITWSASEWLCLLYSSVWCLFSIMSV